MASGHTEASIRHRLSRGTWAKAGRSAYRLLPGDDEHELLRAATLVLPDAVVSHGSAARLHSLDGIPRSLPTVTVAASTTHDFAGVSVRRSSVGVPSAHRTRRMGVATTSVARTVVDLAADMPDGPWRDLAEQCVVGGRTSVAAITAVAESVCGRGRPGSALVGAFLASEDAATSKLERSVARELRALSPIAQYPAPWDPALRLDFAFPEARLAVEADGYRWHATRRRFDADRRRDRAALRAGWLIIRVTWNDLRAPGEFVATVVRLLDERTSG